MWEASDSRYRSPDPVQELRAEIFNLKELQEALYSDVSNSSHPQRSIQSDPKANLQRQMGEISALKENQESMHKELSELSLQLNMLLTKIDSIFQSIADLAANSSSNPDGLCAVNSLSFSRAENSNVSHEKELEGLGCSVDFHSAPTEGIERTVFSPEETPHYTGNANASTSDKASHHKRTFLDINDPTIQILQDAQRINRSFRALFECTSDRLKRRYLIAAVFGIQQPNHKLGIEGSKLISPDSLFNQGFDSILIMLLLYSAFIVPMQLSFWNSNGCEGYPTLAFDMFVDIFFMVDVVYRFFVCHYSFDGSYCDDFREIAMWNFSSPGRFWFNILTSIPLSWIDFILLQQCLERGGSYPPNVDFVHLVKPLRLLKFLRLIKLSTLFRMMNEYIDNPLIVKLVKLLSIIVIAIHVSCCAYWAVKTDSSSDEAIATWISDRNLPANADVWQLYLVCTYAMVTIYTTVGFGDIVAINNSERAYFVVVMLLAGCLFGTWLAQVQEIISAWNSREKTTDERIQPAVDFMDDHRFNRIPWFDIRQNLMHPFQRSLGTAQKENARYYSAEGLAVQWKNVVEELPHNLRSNLSMFIYQSLFLKLLTQLDTFYFQRGDLIAGRGEQADKIMVIVSGRIALYLSKGKPSLDPTFQKELEKNTLKILTRGWAGSWGVDASFCSVENGCIIYVPLAFVTDEILPNPIFANVNKMYAELSSNMPKQEIGVDGLEADFAKSTFHWISLTRGLKEREKILRIKQANEDYKRRKFDMKKQAKGRTKTMLPWKRPAALEKPQYSLASAGGDE